MPAYENIWQKQILKIRKNILKICDILTKKMMNSKIIVIYYLKIRWRFQQSEFLKNKGWEDEAREKRKGFET